MLKQLIARTAIFLSLAGILSSTMYGQANPEISRQAYQDAQSYPSYSNKKKNLIEEAREDEKKGDEVAPISEEIGEDFGKLELVRSKPEKPWFRISADSQTFYNNNVTLVEDGQKDDSVETVSTVDFAFAPEFVTKYQNWYPQLGARWQMFNYWRQEYNNLDFDVLTPYAYLGYKIDNNWFVNAGIEHNTYYSDNVDHKTFLRETSPRVMLNYSLPIDETQYIQASLMSSYYETNPDEFNRFEHSLSLSYTAFLWDTLVVQPYYSFRFTDYYGNDGEVNQRTTAFIDRVNSREDIKHSLGLVVIYPINQNFSVGTNFSFQTNETNLPEYPDYDVYNVGVNLTGVLKF